MSPVTAERIAAALSARSEICAAYLFGSRARNRATRASDVDVAVLFASPISGDRRFELVCEISEEVARVAGAERADVVDLEVASPLLAREVFRGGRLLFSRDEPRRVRVVARQRMRFIDTAPMRRVLDEAVRRRLQEGRFGRLP